MKWFIKCFKQYSDFKGRACRKEFWMFYLFNNIITLALFAIDFALFESVAFSSIYLSVVMFPGLAVAFRRFHDAGKSAWWSLVSIVPTMVAYILFIIAIVLEGNGANILAGIIMILAGILVLAGMIWCIVLLAKKSEPGENKWGLNPKDPAVPTDIVNIDCFMYFVKFWEHYFDFSGRARRSEFWMVFGMYYMISGILMGIATLIYAITLNEYVVLAVSVIILLFSLAAFIPSLALCVRRLHDIGESGWWFAVYLAFAVVFSFVIGVMSFNPSPTMGTIVGVLAIALSIASIIYYITTLKDSQPGENKWGPNPKEEKSLSQTIDEDTMKNI